jgi:2-C-methyl-D-erythritol 2,4-cyclodiphosphate synthase
LRVGNGYDVHKLVYGLPLILGGVRIPFEMGLEGHSDGDALTHAIMNAMLGAAALGDIGIHFPSDDPQFRGADSINLLRQVRQTLISNAFELLNIDTMIICDRPKLSTYYKAMRLNLSAALEVGIDQISVKAATTDGMGYIGRGEGIAAQAVALVKSVRY